jgi:hypothetical protein
MQRKPFAAPQIDEATTLVEGALVSPTGEE